MSTFRRFSVMAWAAALACAAAGGFARAGGAGEEHLVENGTFELGGAGAPEGWAPHVWGGDGRFEYSAAGRGGGRCVLIASEKGGDLSWETFVPVRPGTLYRLSGWIRTEGVAGSGKGALLNVHGVSAAQTPALIGANGWTEVRSFVHSGDRRQLHVNCLFGGWGNAVGEAWFDDVKLEEVDVSALQPAVVIDASRRMEPISPYIFGQFIEHLGRCIYGGIWAEMLEDRKFFHAAGAPESPWRPLGGAGAVRMAYEDALAGELNAVLDPRGADGGAGIVQAGLGLQQGRVYIGSIWLRAEADPGEVFVDLVWGAGPEERARARIVPSQAGFVKHALRFEAAGSSDNGRLEILAGGGGAVAVGAVSLMPADNIAGMRADTLELLKQLDAPIYRWPGGNFVSGYDWRDGVGERDRRPPRKNPAWRGIDSNDFGLDEFFAFCRAVGTEPLVVVNTGFGDAHSAAEEVEYANGSEKAPMGRRRAANGHPEPYGVVWWGIGNEMYGPWQLGHMSLDHYVLKHNEFVRAMRARDGRIKCIAVGASGDWSLGMLRHAGAAMDLISEHFYCGEEASVAAHAAQIPANVRAKAEAHRRYRAMLPELEERDIRIAMDEWNYWYGPEVFGELGVRYTMKDALGIAAGLHEFFRNTDIISMANYAQTVNVIGCIKTTSTAAAFETTGLVLKLYRSKFGRIPVAVSGRDLEPFGIDAAAALAGDEGHLTIGLVNPGERAVSVAVETAGFSLARPGVRWVIAHGDPLAFNEPGAEPAVRITEEAVPPCNGTLQVPAYGVVVYEF